MSFKGAMRAHLFSTSGVTNLVSRAGTISAINIQAPSTLIDVTLSLSFSTNPPDTGQILLKDDSLGVYELVKYVSFVDNGGGSFTFTSGETITNTSYTTSDYGALATGIYSFPAPQEADLPYILLQRITTTEIYNRLNSAGTVVVEQWQASCYASTEALCERIKDQVVTKLNLVNPTSWSNDGFSTSYTVETSVFESETTIPELKDDGSQNYITHKPVTFTVIRSISAS